MLHTCLDMYHTNNIVKHNIGNSHRHIICACKVYNQNVKDVVYFKSHNIYLWCICTYGVIKHYIT